MKEIVIKIDEKKWTYAREHNFLDMGSNELANAIINGTPLPRGHGRVGDITELQKTFHNLCDAYGIDNLSFISDMDMNFDLIPTWVEADKGDKE